MAAHWLVVRPGALGDAVLTLPALAALLGEGGCVTVLGQRSSWAFLRTDAGRLRIADIEGRAWRGLFVPEGFDASEISRLKSYTGAILYLGSTRERAEEALMRAGFTTVLGVAPVRGDEPAGEHAALRLLRPMGELLGRSLVLETASLAADPLFAPTEEERRSAFSGIDFAGGDGPVLVLHPGSGGKGKCWPLEAFAGLVRTAVERWGLKPLVLIGPAESGLVPALRSLLEGVDGTVFAVDRPLRQIAGMLSRARAYVGNDSGISHLAARLVPSLVLFGPTDPALWRPLGSMVRTVSADAGAMDRLPVARVERALSELLSAASA